MKKFYRKIAKNLKNDLKELEMIHSENDLAKLHEFVVDLKNSLPETVAYENSQLLLDGLRVTKVEAMEDYIAGLKNRLEELRCYYLKKAGLNEC